MIYLLSADNNRVYRWSVTQDASLSSLEVGVAPQQLAYSPENGQLYLGYDSGAITKIDVHAANPTETVLAVLPSSVLGLEAAGQFIFAEDESHFFYSHYTFAPSGTQIASEDVNYRSADFVWNAANQRIYYTSEDVSPPDLYWDSIDALTGKLTGRGDTPYHNDYPIANPVRVSIDGNRVLLGTGDIYDGISLEILKSLPNTYADALWLADGSFLTLRQVGTSSRLEHWDSNYQLFNSRDYFGSPLRVVQTAGETTVITQLNGRPNFSQFVPTADVDGDGVDYRQDAFPNDPAASVDRDRDGAPDSWNPGGGPHNSTTGLAIDAFPVDSACQWPSQSLPGNPAVCDIAASIPNYFPTAVFSDDRGIIYLLSKENDRVFRWSLEQEAYLNPIIVGDAPQLIAYSAETDRLYISYASGRISRIDVSTELAPELSFADTPEAPAALVAAGSVLYATDWSGSDAMHYTFGADGRRISAISRYRNSSLLAWNSQNSRMYYTSSSGLSWDIIDSVTGHITAEGGASLENRIQTLLRISPDGTRFVVGSGDVYDALTLDLIDWLAVSLKDAVWLADGSLVTVRSVDNRTLLEHRDANLELLNSQVYDGISLGIVKSGDWIGVVSQLNFRPVFGKYVATNDSDLDGVENRMDAFPLDPAASLDTDHDAAPDNWHAGFTEQSSTTGLTLDAFPRDSACQLPEHGLPGEPTVCDIRAQIPNYTPQRYAIDGEGIVYLTRQGSNRIYRWSTLEQRDLNPIIVSAAPSYLTYSAANSRLYLSYENGFIRQIDPREEFPTERRFAKIRGRLTGLQAADGFLFVAERTDDFDDVHYTFAADGSLLAAATDYLNIHNSTFYAWNVVLSRMYHLSTGMLRWEAIDTGTGEIDGFGSRRESNQPLDPLIRISADGSLLAMASGDIYDSESLELAASLPQPFTDAVWLADGSLVTARDLGSGRTLVEQWDGDLRLFNRKLVDGTPLCILGSDSEIAVVTLLNDHPAVTNYTPSNDGDGDGVPFVDDALPFDPAASVDSDRDGYPDAWNDGSGPSDSIQGLALDAFPNDSACQLAEHALPGTPAVCDIAARIPAYVPTRIEVSEAGIVYLFSKENARVFRWSLPDGADLNPIVVGDGATHFAFSEANHRLYFSYNKSVTEVDLGVELPMEQYFATTRMPIDTVRAVGSLVYVQDQSRHERPTYLFSADGQLLSKGGLTFSSPTADLEWNAVNGRMYVDGSSYVNWQDIDLATGVVTAFGYYDSLGATSPVRTSPDGQLLTEASGDIYDAMTGDFVDSLPIAYVDAAWLDDGNLVTIRDERDGGTLLEHWDANRRLYNLGYFEGTPLRILKTGQALMVVTMQNGRPAFTEYEPTDDADGDGIKNRIDAFALDPAASVDSDDDSYPDAWNPGRTAVNSTQQLTLDAFPSDSACHLAEQAVPGQATVCDIASTIPHFDPQKIEWDDSGVIYLFSPENDRVYRWSTTSDAYLNPIVVDDEAQAMTLSAEHRRLYVGYANGNIKQVDIAAEIPRQTDLTYTADAVTGLQAAGSFIFAIEHVLNSSAIYHHTFSLDGNGIYKNGFTVSDSSDFQWSAVNSRLYFIEDYSSSFQLNWQVVDQQTGAIAAKKWSYEGGEVYMQQPVRVSPDGAIVLLGSGRIYDAIALEFVNALPVGFTDAVWLDDDNLLTIRESPTGDTTLEQWDRAHRLLNVEEFAGAPVRILKSGGQITVVTDQPTHLRFAEYLLDEDPDNDGVTNDADAFPIDAAASRDTDDDGFPDDWNAGYSQQNSTTGLVLDAFTQDAACQTLQQAAPGQPEICMPEFAPTQVVADIKGIIYLLDEQSDRVHRWSTSQQKFLPPILVSDAPQHLAYSADNGKLYLAHGTEAITQVDLASEQLIETPFATTSTAIVALQTAGPFIVAVDNRSSAHVHHTFDANGAPISTRDAYKPESWEWNSTNNRLFFVDDNVSPKDIRWESIDPQTGHITGVTDSPYHGDFIVQHPVRVSPDGKLLVLGSSDIYDAIKLEYRDSLPVVSFTDALWLDNTRLITIQPASEGRTLLQQWNPDYRLFSEQYVSGTPVALIRSGGEISIVTQQAGRPTIVRCDRPSDSLVAFAEGVTTTAAPVVEYELHLEQGPAAGVYNLQVWISGNSGVNSATMEIRDANGNRRSVREVITQVQRDGAVGTAVLVQLPLGNYVVRVATTAGSPVSYRLELHVPGVVQSGEGVSGQFQQLAETALLQELFGFEPAAANVFSEWLGLDVSIPRYQTEFDANLNGMIDPVDLRAILDNSAAGDQPVLASFSQKATQSQQVVPNTVMNNFELKLSDLSISIVHNPLNAKDVNADNSITPLDVLIVINALNGRGAGSLDWVLSFADDQQAGSTIAALFIDVSGDFELSPLDALIVINHLNSNSNGEGEGPSVPTQGDWFAANHTGRANCEIASLEVTSRGQDPTGNDDVRYESRCDVSARNQPKNSESFSVDEARQAWLIDMVFGELWDERLVN